MTPHLFNNILIRSIIESFLNEEEILLYFHKIDINEINIQYLVNSYDNYDKYIQNYDEIFNMERYYSKKFNLKIRYDSFEYDEPDIEIPEKIIIYDNNDHNYNDHDDYDHYYHNDDFYYINDY